MEDLNEGDDVDQSVFALITALCKNLLRNVGIQSDSHLRYLRRIAFSHILNHNSSVIEENQSFTENIPLALFALVASKRSSLCEWSHSEYTSTCKILHKLDQIFSNAQELSWVFDIGRMLIAYELYRPQKTTQSSKTHSMWMHTSKHIGGLESMPMRLLPCTSQLLANNFDDKPSSTEFIWTQFTSHLEQLRLPKRFDSIWIPESVRPVNEENDAISQLTRSTSRIDEGFSSPTDTGTDSSLQFDWSTIDLRSEVSNLEWETFPRRLEKQYFPNARNIHQDIKLSPFNLEKVDLPELVKCIKALLLGVPSHIFNEINGEFYMNPGLYTDETPPSLMFVYCKTFRYVGKLFSKITRLSEDFISLTSASMSVVIQNFILDYQAFIESIPKSVNILRLLLAITPCISQLEYLSGLLDSNVGGWRLLEHLYNDALQVVDPNLLYLSSALFVDCFATYLMFIDKWMFDGEWHPELFFENHLPTNQICDRYSWLRSYTFLKHNAPQFLPSALIYECGKLVHLVQNITSVDEKNIASDCRPKMRMVTDENDFISMKHLWHDYSNTGDELGLETLQKWKMDNYLRVYSAAKEKAAADSLRYQLSKAAEREKMLTQKLENIVKMKQQLANFEQHQNIKRLKSTLSELLEEDSLNYYEIEQMISSLPYRYEFIEQFIKNEECYTKRLLLSCWKEKRYNLNTLRTQYFETKSITDEYNSLALRNDCSDCLSYHDDDRNEVDSAYRSLPPTSTISSNTLLISPSSSLNKTSSDNTFWTPMAQLHGDENSLMDTPAKSTSSSNNETGSNNSFWTPMVQHHDVTKSLTPNLFESLSTATTEDQSFRSPPCEVTSPHHIASSSTNVTMDDVSIVKCENFEIKATADGISNSTNVTTHADLCSIVNQPSPGSETNDKPCVEISVPHYSADLETPFLPPSAPTSDLKTEICGDLLNRITATYSHNTDDDILKPFMYIKNFNSRGNDASNANEKITTHRNSLQNRSSINGFSKSQLHFLVSKSIEYPLQAQTKVMNNLAVYKLFVENDLAGHLKRMRDVFLKNNGYGAQIFVNMLWRNMAHDHPLVFVVHHKLQNILNVAYPAESKFFVIKADYIPQAFDSTNPEVFSFLRLDYSRKWPLNLVITDTVLFKYNEVFQFITSIDFALSYLQQVFQFLREKHLEDIPEYFTQIQLHRHLMLTFLNLLKFYIGSTITDAWNHMFSDLHCSRNPDDLYRVHVRYLKNLHIKLLLHKNSDRIQECFRKAIHYVLVYCQTILLADWSSSGSGQCIRTKFKKLLHTFTNFSKMVSGFRDLVNYFIKEHGYVHLKMLSD